MARRHMPASIFTHKITGILLWLSCCHMQVPPLEQSEAAQIIEAAKSLEIPVQRLEPYNVGEGVLWLNHLDESGLDSLVSLKSARSWDAK